MRKETICSKNTGESLDECRRVEMNVDESQANVDESLDERKRM